MRTMAALRGALAMAAIGVAPGCSFLFVDAPPAEHARMRDFDCTSSRAAPVIDTVLAGVYAVGGVAQAADSGGDTRETAGAPIVAAFGIAALAGASAWHGYSVTSECAAAKKALAERRLTQRAGTCGSDVDCKGDRVCEAGVCVAPPPVVLPPAPPQDAAAPAAPPAPPPASPAPLPEIP